MLRLALSFWRSKRVLALSALSFSLYADAAPVLGRAVHIIDGDGLIVLVSGGRVTVRLEHIDAPEKGQPYGNVSRQSLIAICGSEIVTIDPSRKDENDRTLARVTCGGIDANAEQVKRGMAWVFDRYAPANSPLYAMQAEAQQARRGLWASGKAVPPWQWRRAHMVTSRPQQR